MMRLRSALTHERHVDARWARRWGSRALGWAVATAGLACSNGEDPPADPQTGLEDTSDGTMAGPTLDSAEAEAETTASASTTVATTIGDETSDGSSSGDPVDPPRSTDCDPDDPTLTPEEVSLIDLPGDSWWAAPNTRIRPHCPPDRNGCASVVGAWSGGAFDPVHGRMLIFGGGHGDYSGNEVYAFSVESLTWERLTDPSLAEYESQDPLPDGQPVSRHSYDGLVYLVDEDALLTRGGSRWRDGGTTGVTWRFDGQTHTWAEAVATNAPDLGYCCSNASAYDSSTGMAYFHIIRKLVRYDPVADEWSPVVNLESPPNWPRYQVWGDKTGTFDSHRNLVWFFGSGLYMVYDPAAGAMVTDDWITTGGSIFSNAESVSNYPDQEITTGGREIIAGKAPGLGYDSATDSIVAWVGGGPWILDLEARHWTQGNATGSPPEGPATRGTYGRWRYIERLNVFILVNSVDDDVYFYKHSEGCG